MIFRKAKNGELKQDSGLQQLYDQVMEIDVAETGVKGAKSFFEAQVFGNFVYRINHFFFVKSIEQKKNIYLNRST